jgi:HPt (histidine-containing phosphotransfer) domain-containing protein
MQSDAREIPVLDRSVLESLRRLQESGEPDVVGDVVTLFFSDTSERLALAREAVARADAATLVNVAHQLKGSASLIGAERMSWLASQLHEAVRGGDTSLAPAMVSDLVAAFEETRLALEHA